MAAPLEYPVKPAILQACPADHSGCLGERGGGGEEGMALAQRQCCLWAATAPAPAQCGEAEHMSSRRFLSRLCVATKAAMAGPRPVVMSGPSGAGKSTLLKRLLKDYDGVFGFSVSHTTRKPRPGEVNGKDYHFVTREDMLRAIDKGEFIEHAEFSGNLYGTSKSAVHAVQAQNQICVLDIDMQGVKNIKKTDLKPIYISVFPPSVEILEKRLRDRNTESEESLQKRLNAALSDMEISKEPGLFDQIIINDDLEEAYADLKGALSMEIHRAQKAVIS